MRLLLPAPSPPWPAFAADRSAGCPAPAAPSWTAPQPRTRARAAAPPSGSNSEARVRRPADKQACQPASIIHLQRGGANLADTVASACSGSANLHASSQGMAAHIGHCYHGGCTRGSVASTGTDEAVRRRELPVRRDGPVRRPHRRDAFRHVARCQTALRRTADFCKLRSSAHS